MADNIEIIDEEGDAILVVGPSETQRKLKVSSITLSKASPVFKALFGPHFSEGQARRTPESPVQIALPDDDPAAMTRVCEFVHLREMPDLIEGPGLSYDTTHVLLFAITADKYDLVGKLRLQGQGMLFALLQERSLWQMHARYLLIPCGNMLAASYLLNSPRAFEEVTVRFINRRFPKASVLLEELCGQVLPAKVLLALQERKMSDGTATKGLCLTCVRGDTDDVSRPGEGA